MRRELKPVDVRAARATFETYVPGSDAYRNHSRFEKLKVWTLVEPPERLVAALDSAVR